MRTLAGFLFALTLSAQTSVVPSGPWPICEPDGLPGNPFCIGFVPGQESYFLLIKAPDNAAVAFRYTVTATLVSTGNPVTVSGIIARNDSTTGYPAPGVTFAVLLFGGVAKDFSVQVQELGVIGIVDN